MRLRPNSGEINPEVGDCEDAGTVRGAIYRYPVTGAADALLMDGSKRFVSALEMGSGSLARMPTSSESRYGAPNFVEGTGVGHPPAALLLRE